MTESPAPRVKRLSEADVLRLITNLGSEDFREREAATAALKHRPEAALALLRANRTTESPEVKERLASILPVMMSREEAEKRLERLPEYVKHRQLDRLVETMVACREFITAEHDTHVRGFVKDICTAATGGKKHPATDERPEFKTFAWHNRLGYSTSVPTVVARTAPALLGLGSGTIASDAIEGGSARRSVALCNGDVDIDGSAQSVLIATGMVRVGLGSADAAVIVCLGDVVIDGSGGGLVVVTAGRIRSASGTRSLDPDFSILREKDKEFFSTWKLYSATEAGVTLRSAFGVVWVQTVSPNSPFAKAGVKPGDILRSIDGTPIGHVREANRMLCRATVSWGATDIRVVRDNTKRDIIVTLNDW